MLSGVYPHLPEKSAELSTFPLPFGGCCGFVESVSPPPLDKRKLTSQLLIEKTIA